MAIGDSGKRESVFRLKRGSSFTALIVFWVFSAFYPIVGKLLRAEEPPVSVQEWWVIAGKDAYVLSEPGPTYRNKFEVGENANLFVTSPDNSLLAIGSHGATTPNFTWGGRYELWPKPGSHSSITLIKNTSLELIGQFTVPFRPGFLAFSTDQKTIVAVSIGQVSKNKEKHIAPQIFLMDVSSGKIHNPVELASEPTDFWYVPEKDRMMVPCEGFAKRADAPPELIVFDTVSGSVEKMKLPSAPSKWHEAGVDDLRYLELETGVAVVNTDGKLAGEVIQAGTQKLFFMRAPKGNQFFLAGKTQKQGKLALLEGGRVSKSVDVPIIEAVLFDGSLSRMILCAKKQGVILNPQTLAELDKIPLPNSFREVRLAPGEKRLYINQYGDQVVVVDLEKKQEVARFTSGRGSIKFLQEMAAASANALGQINYALTGIPSQYVQVPQAVQTMAFSPSGNFVYVFNSQTNDITVVETVNHTSPRKVPTGPVSGRDFLWQLPGGTHLISVGFNKLLSFDTEKGEVVTEQQFPNKSKLQYEPSLGLLFVHGETGIEVHRPAPFEKVKSLDAATKLLLVPEAQRFFVFTPKGAGLYDYDMKLQKELEGIPEGTRVYFVPQKGAPVSAGSSQ